MDNTIIILWGDHGWHLGDLRVWGKHTLHETSLSSALVIKAPQCKPGIKNNQDCQFYRYLSDSYGTLQNLLAQRTGRA